MTLQSSGKIALSDVNVELGLASSAEIGLDYPAVKSLFNWVSGAISLSQGYSTSSLISLATPVLSGVGYSNYVTYAWGVVPVATSYDVSFNGGTATNQTTRTFTSPTNLDPGTNYDILVTAKTTTSGYRNSLPSIFGATTWFKVPTPAITFVSGKDFVNFIIHNNNSFSIIAKHSIDNVTWTSVTIGANSTATATRPAVGSAAKVTLFVYSTATGRVNSSTAFLEGTSLAILQSPTIAFVKKVNSIDFTIHNPNSITVGARYGYDGVTWTNINISPNSNSVVISKAVSGDAVSATMYAYFTQTGNADSATINQSGLSLPALPAVVTPAPYIISATATSITVSWGASAGATTYNLKRDNVIISGLTGQYTDTGLTQAKSYVYSVQAVNERGEAAYSSTVTGWTSPSQISNFWLSNFTQTTVDLNFSRLPEATHYFVKKDGVVSTAIPASPASETTISMSGWALINRVGTADPKVVTMTGLTADTKYQLTIAAAKETTVGVYALSSYFILREAWTLYPAFTITVAKAANSITANYTGVASNTFKLYVGGVYDSSVTSTGSISKYGLSAATSYDVKVSRSHDNGETFSNVVTVVLAPSPAANVSSSAIDKTTFTLSWNTFGTVTTRVFINNVDKGLQTSPYAVTGYAQSTEINYYVRSYNSISEYADSNGTKFFTKSDAPAKPVISLVSKAIDVIAISCSNVQTAGTGAVTYDFYISWALYYSAGTARTCDFSSLAASTEYCIYVVAKALDGTSTQSDNYYQTTALAAVNLRSYLASKNQVGLWWDCAYSGAVFKVIFDGTVVSTTSPTTGYTDSAQNLTAGTSHTYGITAGRYDPSVSSFVYDSAGAASLVVYTDPPKPTMGTSNSTGLSSIYVSWSANGSAVGTQTYELYRDGSLIYTALVTNYSDALPLSTHEYKVRAIGKNGNYSDSEAITLTSLDPKLNNLRQWMCSDTRLGAFWDTVITGSFYKVYFDGTLVSQDSSNTNHLTPVTAFAVGSGHTISVTTGKYNSQTSSYIYDSATSVSITVYTDPSNTVIATTLYPGRTYIVVAWSNQANAAGTDHYEIYSDGSLIYTTVGHGGYSYNHDGANATHSYMVRAIGKNGHTADSAPVTLSNLSAPGTPTGISAFYIGSSFAFIQFSASTSGGPVADYHITITDTSDATRTWTDSQTSVSSFYRGSLSSNQQHKVVMWATNAAGSSPTSTAVYFTTTS